MPNVGLKLNDTCSEIKSRMLYDGAGQAPLFWFLSYQIILSQSLFFLYNFLCHLSFKHFLY